MPEPELVPIYDSTAPIACTITEDEIPERVQLIERLRAAMTAIDRTPTGLLIRLRDEPGVRADLAAFVVDEKRCCHFWGFDVIDQGDAVALRWDGPPAVDGVFDQLQAYFTSDAPISMLDGLL